MTSIYYDFVNGPVGQFLVAGSEEALCVTAFSSSTHEREPQSDWIKDGVPLRYAIEPLEAYFAGESVHFNVPLAPAGTPFQLRVWGALQQVKYGETASYGEIARRVGSPLASRAVGAANRANCLPIFIPCHRIIGSNGALTGFGGGLDAKSRLLELESTRDQMELF